MNINRTQPRIFFGFYGGLGDLVSDKKIIDLFHKKGYDITISVKEWLVDLARYLFPKVGIAKFNTLKEIISQPYNTYDYVFLTPNYLAIRFKSIFAYILKYMLVKLKSSEKTTILAYDIQSILCNAARPKIGYFNLHFFQISLNLLSRHITKLNDISKDEIARLTDTFSDSAATKPMIGEIFIFPFSGNQNKDYGLNNFLNLGKTLADAFPQIPIRFFVAEKELSKIDVSVRRGFRIESKSLIELVKQLAEDVLIISNDSGPAHLAAYYRANTITLFGPTSAGRYHPIGKGCNISITAQSRAVKDIQIDQIFQTVMNKYQFKERNTE
ncbi:glycosyltransferase family 9 protein [Nitrospira sp. T9]|uniref:glycosyltransferase family 9 protein n=1 Tax=unclassified Nitrospira TaxID=2652172 RepID=UPI003F955F97